MNKINICNKKKKVYVKESFCPSSKGRKIKETFLIQKKNEETIQKV